MPQKGKKEKRDCACYDGFHLVQGTSADQDQNSFEEVSHAYDKLEHEYQKFLSECGISNSGYWRGGSTG